MQFADMIELSEEEAEHLGYSPEDEIYMTKTAQGFIIFKKNNFIDGLLGSEYEDFA